MTVRELIACFCYIPEEISCSDESTGEYEDIVRDGDYNQFQFDLHDLLIKYGDKEVTEWYYNYEENYLSIEV